MKEVLLKLVLQAVSTYAMSLFKLSRCTCKEIASLISKFWWDRMQKEYGIHWKNWRHLGNTKSQEGLSFRDFETFNKALLANQFCQLIESLNSLMGQILKSKYFPASRVLDVNLLITPLSFGDFYDAIDLVKEGMMWHIGDSQSIHIWDDNCCPIIVG